MLMPHAWRLRSGDNKITLKVRAGDKDAISVRIVKVCSSDNEPRRSMI
jgi:hypothetical protein